MLGLNEMQHSWPVGEWIFQLFRGILDRLSEDYRPSNSRESTALVGRLGGSREEISTQFNMTSLPFDGGQALDFTSSTSTDDQSLERPDLDASKSLPNPMDFFYDDFTPGFFTQLPSFWETPMNELLFPP